MGLVVPSVLRVYTRMAPCGALGIVTLTRIRLVVPLVLATLDKNGSCVRPWYCGDFIATRIL